jgi:hypothetical protein
MLASPKFRPCEKGFVLNHSLGHVLEVILQVTPNIITIFRLERASPHRERMILETGMIGKKTPFCTFLAGQEPNRYQVFGS